MRAFCKGKGKKYSEGEVVELYNNKELLHNFRITFEMCEDMLRRLIFFKYGLPPDNYTIKILKRNK